MSLAIVAYPQMADDDRRWIEDFRRAHDPQASLIAAHFTLVFPAEVPADDLVGHASTVLHDFPPFSFVLGRARTVKSVFGQGAHVFLVPDHGATRIIDLHDRLYSGFLEPHLRTDIPFIPHITVAAHVDVDACERLAATWNEQSREIRGEVTGVDVVPGEAQARSLVHLELPVR
jgi:2'-5' RNA ligase